MLPFASRHRRLVPVAALAATVLFVPAASADSNNNNSAKLRAAVTLDGVQRHLTAFQEIATAAGGNRFAGTAGHDASAAYVVDQLTAAGYAPTVQEFEYDAFFERTPSQLQQLSPNAATYVNGIDFRVLSYSGSGDVTAPLARPSGDSRGCYAADWAGFAVGSIALVERGTPAGFPGGSCTFRIKLDNAQAAGATAILVYNNVAGVVNGTLGATGLSTIPGLGITQALGQQLAAQVATSPTVMRVRTDTGSERLTTRNVLVETAGGDANNVVMAGAHLDSVTAGPGINDNGSGSAAILETAIQMAKVSPRNKVRFAWWSAEESGLIGSNYYIANLPQAERDKIALYLNFDMVGSPNFARFVYDGDNSTGTGAVGPAGSDVIESVFYGYFESQGLYAEPSPFNGRSDYGPFIAAGVGIPAGGLFTGAEGIKTAAQAARYGGTAGVAFDPCYHAACDTSANISTVALDTNSDAIAHAVITFAQSTELVNGIRGKGNFKRPAQGDNDGTGTGGGGGLHDDHHDEEAYRRTGRAGRVVRHPAGALPAATRLRTLSERGNRMNLKRLLLTLVLAATSAVPMSPASAEGPGTMTVVGNAMFPVYPSTIGPVGSFDSTAVVGADTGGPITRVTATFNYSTLCIGGAPSITTLHGIIRRYHGSRVDAGLYFDVQLFPGGGGIVTGEVSGWVTFTPGGIPSCANPGPLTATMTFHVVITG